MPKVTEFPELIPISASNVYLYAVDTSNEIPTSKKIQANNLNLSASSISASSVLFAPSGEISASTVQGALTELDTEKLSTSASISGSLVRYTPTGGISASTLQGAITELDTEKLSTSASIADLSDVTILAPVVGNTIVYVGETAGWWDTTGEKATIVATTNYTNGNPALMVDGNTTTEFIADTWCDAGYYFKFDLGGNHRITQINTYTINSGGFDSCVIQASSNGAFAGEQVNLTGTVSFKDGLPTTITFTQNVDYYRYYRIYCTARGGSGYSRVKEVDFNNQPLANHFENQNMSAGLVNFTPSGTISASTVQGALAELDSEKLSTSASISGSLVRYTPTGGISASTVQGAITELDSEKLSISGSISGSLVSYTPTGGISASTVQGALTELDTEKLSISGSISGSLVSYTPTGGISASTVQAAITELDNEKLSAASKYRQFLYTVISGSPTFLTDDDGHLLTVALDLE